MAYTYEDLKGKTVAELREIAQGIEHPAVQGHTQMNKEHLLMAMCQALNIDTHAHHEVKGINKAGMKARIRELKKERADALASKDRDTLKSVRRRIHGLKRQLREATA